MFEVVLIIALIVVMIAAMWMVFEKAGQPGWAAIIPFYNTYVLVCGVAQKEIVWFILCFIPIVNFVILLLVSLEVAQEFGRGAGFGVGLFFLGFIFYPILAFGPAEYEGRRKREPVLDSTW